MTIGSQFLLYGVSYHHSERFAGDGHFQRNLLHISFCASRKLGHIHLVAYMHVDMLHVIVGKFSHKDFSRCQRQGDGVARVELLSLLNAAVIVLKDAGPEHPMNCKEILEAILERQLWTPTDCKTPEQTLYGSIFREINTKEHPRIVKSNVKGKFVIAD